MRNIPDLFRRDPDDRRFVVAEVAPGQEWVLAGEGRPTRQYAGVLTLFAPAAGAIESSSPVPELQSWYIDAGTDWEPAWQSKLAVPMLAAVRALPASDAPRPGTHELVGPGVRRNVDRLPGNRLIAHGDAELVDAPRTFDALREWLLARPYKGVVFQHPDGRMAKVRRRDLRA